MEPTRSVFEKLIVWAQAKCHYDDNLSLSEAFVTLATTEEYCCGAMVLAESLKRTGTTKQLVCMITRTISESMKTTLEKVFDHLELVDVLDSNDKVNLKLLSRPDLGVTFTKLHCWRLTQYSKAVFMDADTLVIKNIDDLFEREELSASPDPGWPDCFNSGVFVFKPSVETYEKLLAFALSEGSFDGGDQGLLNMFFSDWATKDIARHLPFVYNCVSQAFYSYAPAMKQFRSKVKVIHFIGALKPWHQEVNTDIGALCPKDEISQQSVEFLNFWWQIFVTEVKPKISQDICQEMGGFVGHLATLEIGSGPIFAPLDEKPLDRQMSWERGEIDYTGTDRFEHIKATLDRKLSK